MVRIVAVNVGHLVDVVVLHRVNELLNQWLVKLEPIKVLGWVFFGDSLLISVPIDEVASVFGQFAHFGVVVAGRGAHVAHIARDNALTGYSGDQSIQQHQHGAIVVHDLGDEALAIFDLDQRVNGELDVLAVADILQILSHTHVEQVDLLKQVIEALDNLEVTFLERLVKLGQLNRVVDHIVISVTVLDVAQVEEYLEVFGLLRVSKLGLGHVDRLSVRRHELVHADTLTLLHLFSCRLLE